MAKELGKKEIREIKGGKIVIKEINPPTSKINIK